MTSQKPEIDKSQQIRIEIDDAVADGTYANLSFISTNSSEFILDFAKFLPGNTRGKVISRVVFAPVHAKAFLKMLTDAVENYEKNFGQIKFEPANRNIGFNVKDRE